MDIANEPLAFVRMQEGRQARGVAKIAREAEPIAGGWMAWGGPDSWLNQAVGLGLHGPVSAQDVDRLIVFFRERGALPLVEVATYADPSLTRALAARGFVPHELAHVLALPLGPDGPTSAGETSAQPPGAQALGPLLPHGWPPGLEIVQVDPRDAAQVEQFIAASTIGFRPPDQPISPEIAAFARGVVQSASVESFLALVDGEPAGGGSVEFAGEIAALISTSVDERFRRRGIQQALIATRLASARAHGATLAAIESTPGTGTERNAHRLGFHLAYAKVILALPASAP